MDIFEYIFQELKCVEYVSNCCGLSHASTELICHELQPQFAAHAKLEQEHGSSKTTQVDVNDIIHTLPKSNMELNAIPEVA